MVAGEDLKDIEYKNIQEIGSLMIVSGPVFFNSNPEKIGEGQVCVPDTLFKVMLDPLNGGEAIGFIIPNNLKSKDVEKYAVSVRKVEEVTGLDFFNELPLDSQDAIESKFNSTKWNSARVVQNQEKSRSLRSSKKTKGSSILGDYACGSNMYRTPMNYCYAEKSSRKVRVKDKCCEFSA